jgi:hypothetical protein
MSTHHSCVIEMQFLGIEKKLQSLNDRIQHCLLYHTFNNLVSLNQFKINNALKRNESLLITCIYDQRQYINDTLRKSLEQNLESIKIKKLVLKLTTTKILDMLSPSLIGHLFYAADFQVIRKRLVYLSFLDLANEFRHQHEIGRFINVIR